MSDPMIGQHYLSYDDGYYGMQEWAKITDLRDERIFYDVLQGENEGRSMSKPHYQFLREYYHDSTLSDPPGYKQVFGQ